MFDTALIQRLSGLAPNLYPCEAPKGYSLPAVVYNISDVQPYNTLEWTVAGANTFVQIDVYHTDHYQAKVTAEAIRSNMIAWSDSEVPSCYWTSEAVTIDKTTETRLYRVMMHFECYTVLTV